MFDLVVPIYNGMHHARSCLRSLLSWVDRPFHLYVVDDASDPYTATALRDLLSHYDPALWTLLTNETNRGYLQSVNRGARAGRNPYIVFINSDTVTPRGAFSKLAAAFAHDERIGVVNAVSNWANWTRICWSIPPGHNIHSLAQAVEAAGMGQYPDLGNASGFFFATRRTVFESVGGFDEAYGQGYWEEVDYCMKVLDHRWRVVVDDRLYVFHHGWGTFRESGRNAHMARNRAIFMERWGRRYKQLEARWKSSNPLPYVEAEVLEGRVNEPEALRRPVSSQGPQRHSPDEGDMRLLFLISESSSVEEALAIFQMVNELLLRGFDANVGVLGPIDERIYRVFPCYFRPYVFENEAAACAVLAGVDGVIATNPASARVAAIAKLAHQHIWLLYWPKGHAPDAPHAESDTRLFADWMAPGQREARDRAHAGREMHPLPPGLNVDFFHQQHCPRKNQVLIIGGLESRPAFVARIRQVFIALHGRRPEITLATYGHVLSERAWPVPVYDYGKALDIQALAQALNESKVVIDLSDATQCPWRALAAMACGALLIVSPKSPQAAYAKHCFNALHADPHQTTEVVDRVLTAFDDDALRQRLATQGMETARDYDLAKQCDHFTALVAELLDRHRP